LKPEFGLHGRRAVGFTNIQERGASVHYTIECEQEEDGRWIAEVPDLPGVLVYGVSAEAAMASAEVLALRVLAERLEHGESRAIDISISIPRVA
jgi:predicted RNase H-like HicB family nuclease